MPYRTTPNGLGLRGGQGHKTEALNALGPVVYAARVNDEGLIKIGHTAKLGRRLWDLKYRYWVMPDLLAFRFGTRDDEQAIHASLAASLSHGREWYLPTTEVLDLVDEMRSDLGLPIDVR